MVSSVNGAFSAQVLQLLGVSNRGLAQSAAALASGNRLTQASTDISALSIATGMQSQISGMRSAQNNIAQASSFLQVAEGGMAQQQQILDRMAALSVQANSGALSDSARRGLNTEFQALSEELNRIAGSTNFNGVNLLDGSLGQGNDISLQSAAAGEQASGAVTFTANVGAGQTLTLNGVTLTEGVDFTAGGTTAQTTQNLANTLNNDSRFAGFTFDANGASLEITAEAAGEAGNQFTIDQAGSTASFIVTGDDLSGAGVFSLQGGTNAGISAGDTNVSGSIGSNLLTSGTGSAANTQFNFGSESDIQAGDTIQIGNGEGGFTTFTYVTGTPASANQIQIGDSLEQTLDNTAAAINDYSGVDDYGVRQLTATVQGNSIRLEGNVGGNVTDVNGAALTVNLNTTGGAATTNTLNNGSTGGVNFNNFTGNIIGGQVSGFSAQYTGADALTASVSIGGTTYTANISDTTPGANSTVTFRSQNGDSFDVTLAAGNGVSVGNQGDANTFANQLNAAFSTLDFTQTRNVEGFGTSGQLIGGSLEITSGSLVGSAVSAQNVSVGDNGDIEITINGETFRGNAGDNLGAGEIVRLTSTTNPGNSLEFTNGSAEFDLTAPNNLQQALEINLGIPGNQGAQFQIGANASDVENFSIGDTSTASLFDGQSLNLLSADAAASALSYVRSAQDYLTSQRAEVGASMESLDYASSALDIAIQNQEAARAALADTDIASESTNNALLQLRSQSAIATLVQTNRMQGNLLSLIGE